MMRFQIPFLVVTVLAVSTSGCGLFSSNDPYAYRDAKSGKPLEIPEGFAKPPVTQQEVLPEKEPASTIPPEELEIPPQIIKGADLAELDLKEKSVTASSQDQVKENQAAKPALAITATKNANGESLLIVDAEFDKVWSRVKPALEELGFTIDDEARGNEMYAISKVMPAYEFREQPVHPADEKPEVREEFQIHVKPSDGKTRITVHNKFGQIDGSGLADHLLLQIKELMENPK